MSTPYADVTARILLQLESGAAPWVKPWSATPGRNIPCNAATGRAYSGANVVLLWMSIGRFTSPRYLTVNQAHQLGGRIKDECWGKGFVVYFVKRVQPKKTKVKTTDDEQKKAYSMLRSYIVYNVDQCEGLPERLALPADKVKPRNPDEQDATLEEFITATGADYRRDAGGNQAFYNPGGDFVAMPPFAAFNSAANYYSTAFHELGHWTGHASRLNRDFSGRFGTRAYAAEELVAELTAAFLCAEFSLDGELRHAGYIAHWIELLKDDTKAFFTAAAAAQKAADHIRRTIVAEMSAAA